MMVHANFTANINNFKKRLNDQSGQIAVVVFLIMAVLLVVGLSLATRTSQEIEQAGQAEDTTRVFNAAESGIEAALDEATFTAGVGDTVEIDPINTASVDISVEPTFDFAPIIQSGQSTTVYTDPAGGGLIIRWGSGTTCATNASIVVTRYVATGGGNYKAEHEAYNPYNLGDCGRNNQFTNANVAGGTGNINGVSTPFQSRVDLNLEAGTAFIRIKPLYTSTQFHVSGDAIDSQSHIIRSQATDESTGNKEVRTIEVTRTRPAPPTILDYALYSGGTLEKN
jgi:type II secretory pathway pseudopilin PulG